MQDHDLCSLDLDANAEAASAESLNPLYDSHFPYDNGPGHADSTPQQLSIMWRMLNAVGVKRFRPDFSISQKTGDNKWLWMLSLEIFLKLVQCGEYPGVFAEPENQSYIKKCLDTYVQTLTKRYFEFRNEDFVPLRC